MWHFPPNIFLLKTFIWHLKPRFLSYLTLQRYCPSHLHSHATQYTLDHVFAEKKKKTWANTHTSGQGLTHLNKKKDFLFTFSSHQNKKIYVLAVDGAFMTQGKKSLSWNKNLTFVLIWSSHIVSMHRLNIYVYEENKDAFLLALMRPPTFVVLAFKMFHLRLTFLGFKTTKSISSFGIR